MFKGLTRSGGGSAPTPDPASVIAGTRAEASDATPRAGAERDEQEQLQPPAVGGYQLFAHIIQGSQLAARDSSGESDPVVKCTLSCTGEMLMTEPRQKTLNPIFEENLTFDFEVSTPGEMFASNFVMEVWDADALADDMIGSFQLDLGKIWDLPEHRLFRRWVALMDDTNDEHVGIQGYLQVSLTIVKDGDDVPEEPAAPHDDELRNPMVAPSVEMEGQELTVSCYEGAYIANTDGGVLSAGAPDPYVQVEYDGLEVKCKYVENDDSPSWNEQIVMPVMAPKHGPPTSDRVRISVWDHDALADDCIGAVVVHISDTANSRYWRKPCWVHLYGAPPEHDSSGQTGAAISGVFESITGAARSGKRRVGPPREEGSTPAERMNLGFEPGSAYRGRALISLMMNSNVEKPTPSFPGDRPISPASPPPNIAYILRVMILEGNGLPTEACGMLRSPKMAVRIRCGEYSDATQEIDIGQFGRGKWYEELELEMHYPNDWTQVPDLFVELEVAGERASYRRFAFTEDGVFHGPGALEDLAYGGRDSREEVGDGSRWWSLQRDIFGRCTAHEFPGSLLLCMAIEPQDDMQSRDIATPHIATAAAAKRMDRSGGADDITGVDPVSNDPEVEWDAFEGMGRSDFDDKLREVKSKILKTQKAMKRLKSKATPRLFVRVKKATNLKDVEMFQSMDPYCRLQIGSRSDLQDASKATRLLSQDTPIHKGGGINPVWDHRSEFELRDEDTHLRMSCWDRELLGKDDLIGQRTIDLSSIGNNCKDIREEPRVDEALDIYGDDDRKSHGTVHFALQYSPADRKAKSQMEQHVETLGILEEEQDVLRRANNHFFPSTRGTQGRRKSFGGGRSSVSSPARSGSAGTTAAPRARRPPLTKPKEYEYDVRVHVHQARGLPVKDTDTHSSDPYLKATIAGQEGRTATKPQNLNPQWYETLQFHVMLPARERIERGLAPQLLVQLFDEDMDADDFIGRLTVDLQDMGGAHMPKRPRWHRIVDNDTGSDCGSVLLAFQLIGPLRNMDTQDIPPMPGDAPYVPQLVPKTRDCTLEFFVLGCRSLKPLAFVPPGSPYVEVSFFSTDATGAEKAVTSKSNTPSVAAPNFCEVIKKRIQVPEDALYGPVLELAVRDPRFGGTFLRTSSALLGTATIPLRKYLPWIPSNYMRAQRQSRDQNRAAVAGGPQTPSSVERFRGTSGEAMSMVPRESMDVSEYESMLSRSAAASASDADGAERIYGLESARSRRGSSAAGRSQRLTQFGAVSRDSTVIDLDGDTSGSGSDTDSDDDSVEDTAGGGSTHAHDAAADNEIEIDDTPAWLRGRQIIPDELEDWLFENPAATGAMVYRPFEEWRLARHSKESTALSSDLASNQPKFGRVKGFIRVVDHSQGAQPAIAFPINIKELIRPKAVTVRLYVIKATGLAALDGGNSSDPYLSVRLGDTEFSCRDEVVRGTLKPYFGRCFQFETQLPGPTQLQLAVYDWDLVGKDDLIGTTTIDLEDRYFSPEWRALSQRVSGGVGGTGPPQQCWPIETRTLRDHGSFKSRGKVQCWVDVLHKAEARAHAPIDIAMAPPEDFELRVILYRTRKVPIMDARSGTNDAYVTATLTTVDTSGRVMDTELETDTHWRAEKGQGVFNWRFRYQLRLPLAEPTRLTLKLWDKDVLGPSDLIGSCTLDLNELEQPSLMKRRKKKSRDEVGTTGGHRVTSLLKKGLKVYRDYKSYSAAVNNMTETDLRQNLDQIRMKRPGQSTKAAGRQSDTATRSRLGAKLPVPVDASVEQLRAMLLQYSPNNQLSATAVRWPESNSGAAGIVESIQGFLCCGFGGPADDDDSGREKPPVRWVKLAAPGDGVVALDDDHDERRGELELAIELLPAELAAKRLAGDGRSEPNQHPSLPEPDRTSLLALANPLAALRSLGFPGGVGLLKLLLCVACCAMFALMLPLILSHVISAKIDAITGG